MISAYTLLWLLVGILLVVITMITLLLRRRAKTNQEDHIPGVEEMAKTYFFWSRYHGQNEDD